MPSTSAFTYAIFFSALVCAVQAVVIFSTLGDLFKPEIRGFCLSMSSTFAAVVAGCLPMIAEFGVQQVSLSFPFLLSLSIASGVFLYLCFGATRLKDAPIVNTSQIKIDAYTRLNTMTFFETHDKPES